MSRMKLLVLSNEPLSKSTSNGRTMANLLSAFSPSELAQFYLHGTPDFSLCDNYYKVSDRDALSAFTRIKPYRKSGVVASAEITKAQSVGSEKKHSHSCRNMVLRDIVWKSLRWWNCAFNEFLDAFAPDAVLLQAGDSPFMFRIARKISEKRKIPLLMYNSEAYVLKEVLYSSASKKDFWHRTLQNRLKKEYGRFMHKAAYCFYITEYMEAEYQAVYPHPGKSCALYTSSSMPLLEDHSGDVFRVVYCGNLGVGRLAPLCDVAQVLFAVNTEATLDIYGRFLSEEDEHALCSYPNVRYFGVVPYDEIPGIMSEASLLLHVENKDRLENLRYAFSTKIADSLASGRPFLVYASREYPFVQYLAKHRAAHLADQKEELKQALHLCMENESFLKEHTELAVLLAREKHDMRKNAELLKTIVEGVIKV